MGTRFSSHKEEQKMKADNDEQIMKMSGEERHRIPQIHDRFAASCLLDLA